MKFGLTLIGFLCALTSLDLNAQCLADRHSTDGYDGWISCNRTQNPNPAHGVSHWILYDFQSAQSLHQMQLWNVNHPEYVDDGIKDVIVEYSEDGSIWSVVDTFTFPRAIASAWYTGFIGPDLKGVNAQYLLLTPISNYGGGCYGLSEMKVYIEEANFSELHLAMTVCESDGQLSNLSGGMTAGGTYSGVGVVDNGDETFDFNALLAGQGQHVISYNYQNQLQLGYIDVLPCTDAICGECISCNEIDQAMLDADPIIADTYFDKQLQSTGRVSADNDVIFFGSQSVELKPNFEISASGMLTADIRLCYDNEMPNAGFEDEETHWDFNVHNPATGVLTFESSETFEGGKAAKIVVSQTGSSHNHVNIRQQDLSFQAGQKVRVSFALKGSAGTTIQMRVHGNSSPSKTYLDKYIEIKDHWQVHGFEFEADITRIESVQIQFRCGKEIGTYYIDQVSWATMDQ